MVRKSRRQDVKEVRAKSKHAELEAWKARDKYLKAGTEYLRENGWKVIDDPNYKEKAHFLSPSGSSYPHTFDLAMSMQEQWDREEEEQIKREVEEEAAKFEVSTAYVQQWKDWGRFESDTPKRYTLHVSAEDAKTFYDELYPVRGFGFEPDDGLPLGEPFEAKVDSFTWAELHKQKRNGEVGFWGCNGWDNKLPVHPVHGPLGLHYDSPLMTEVRAAERAAAEARRERWKKDARGRD